MSSPIMKYFAYDHLPEKLKEVSYATYGPELPTVIGIHDVARLCGYEGFCRDNIGQANKTAANAVTGWLRSKDGHRENLLDPAWREVGCARSGGGQGAVCVAVFGTSF